MIWRILPGLVGSDLGVGGGLDCDGVEVVGVVSCEMEIYTHTTTTTHQCTTSCTTHAPTHAQPGLPVNQIPNPMAGNLQASGLHDTAAVCSILAEVIWLLPVANAIQQNNLFYHSNLQQLQFQYNRCHLHQVDFQEAWTGLINKFFKVYMLPLCYYNSYVVSMH